MHCLVSLYRVARLGSIRYIFLRCMYVSIIPFAYNSSNDVDVIVFSVFEHGYKQCSDEPMGTYIVPVPIFLKAYLEQKYQNMQDLGNDDYAIPDASAYSECQSQVIQNQEYYLQMGCTDGTSQSLSVNIYSDNTCTSRDLENGLDDSNLDVSEVQVSLRSNCGFRSHFSTYSHHIALHFIKYSSPSNNVKLVLIGSMWWTIKLTISFTRIVKSTLHFVPQHGNTSKDVTASAKRQASNEPPRRAGTHPTRFYYPSCLSLVLVCWLAFCKSEGKCPTRMLSWNKLLCQLLVYNKCMLSDSLFYRLLSLQYLDCLE